MRTKVAALGLALTLAACASPPPSPPAPDLAAAEQAIRSKDAAWLAAAVARDPAAAAAMFADDGMAFRDMAEPLSGPAAYQAYQTKFYADNPKAVSTWTTRSILVAPSGDFAVQNGSWADSAAGPMGDKESRGNFVTVWKKVGDDWKVAADIGQTIPAPAKP
jgi:ketosteroid isomerase-like protein